GFLKLREIERRLAASQVHRCARVVRSMLVLRKVFAPSSRFLRSGLIVSLVSGTSARLESLLLASSESHVSVLVFPATAEVQSVCDCSHTFPPEQRALEIHEEICVLLSRL